MTHVNRLATEHLASGRAVTLAGVADGAEALVTADLARSLAASPQASMPRLIVVCRDGTRMAQLSQSIAFFAPDLPVTEFPAWDCLPYDRVSPHTAISAQRMLALAQLSSRDTAKRPAILLTTVSAAVQRVPPRAFVSGQSLIASPGNVLDMAGVVRWLELNGFIRASLVRDAGEYAVRGGIIDLFAPGMELGIRLDFFGDTLEFDPKSSILRRSGRPGSCAGST